MIDKPSIVETIGAHVQLRRAGKEYVGLCPFHPDKRPSLYVNEDKGVFLCRVCQPVGESLL